MSCAAAVRVLVCMDGHVVLATAAGANGTCAEFHMAPEQVQQLVNELMLALVTAHTVAEMRKMLPETSASPPIPKERLQ